MADTAVIAQEGFTSGEPPVTGRRYVAAADASPASVTVVLAHGAGGGMTHPFMVACATGLAARGLDAVTFNFPYMERRAKAPNPAPQLEACYRTLIATLAGRGWLEGRRLVIGGKSMGGRMATMVAAGAEAVAHPIAGVVALGYPLHPPGRPQQLRVAHLAAIRPPLLVVQGTRDDFGGPDELVPHLAPLGARATIHTVENGDHSFKVTGLQRGTQPAVLEGILDTVASWCRGLRLVGWRRVVHVPLEVLGPRVALGTLRLEPLALARGADAAGLEGVPLVQAGAGPLVLAARLPAAVRAADARAAGRLPQLLDEGRIVERRAGVAQQLQGHFVAGAALAAQVANGP